MEVKVGMVNNSRCAEYNITGNHRTATNDAVEVTFESDGIWEFISLCFIAADDSEMTSYRH